MDLRAPSSLPSSASSTTGSRAAVFASAPSPKLSHAEAITIEVVGEFLSMDTDEAIFRYFREHYGEWFSTLHEVHRTTFALCESMPLPTCLFARAYRCKRFKGEAAFGKDTLLKQTFYGFLTCT